MSEFKYEIGDEFRSSSFKYWMRIVARHTTKAGVNVYWMENEVGSPSSYSESIVDEWTKIEPFFEVGDWWKDDGGNRYEVTHVDEELTAVWVIATSEIGKTERDTFNGRFIWRAREEQVIRNRKG